jgi:hypothetical protein
MGSIFSESRDQGFQDLPLRIGQVRCVGFPAWHHFPPLLSFFSLLLLSFIGFMTLPLHFLRYGLIICPWAATSCFVTPATAQALHRVGIAPSNYATYNLVLTLFHALILLGIGGLLFWRKPREPLCLAASFVFVTIGLKNC